MSEHPPILTASEVAFAYRAERPVLAGVDLTAREGELLCILGPNGSGKTTLLKCLLGVLKPSAGAIAVADKPLRRHSAIELAKLVSYVPQSAQSAFAYTVRQIITMGRTPHMGRLGVPTDLDRRVVDAAMAMTGVTAFADRHLEALSGGEQQTVMIARALAQQPRLMLLDEPTCHLDVKHQLDIYALMAKLAHEWSMAVVCVSHDVNLAARFADRLVLLRDGVAAAAGAPSEVVTADILRSVYDVNVRLVDVGLSVPMVIAE